MNKTIVSMTAAVVIGGSSLSAFIPTAADLGVTNDLTFTSEYVFRGYEVADNSFQPSIEASVGDFYAGLFANLPIDIGGADGKNDVNEIHYYGGFALEIPGLENIILDVGATVYHLPNLSRDRTHEGFVGSTFSDVALPGLDASAYYFYDLDRRAHVLEGALGYSLAIGTEASLDLSALYGNQFGGGIKDRAPGAQQVGHRINQNYHYYGASAELPYRLNELSTVTAGAHYQTAEKADLGNFRGKNFFWTVSYTAGF